jgi:hypothetical protein
MSCGAAGPEPPPERPSLAATHPEISRRGNDILRDITQIMAIEPDTEGIATLVEGLPGFFDKVSDFVRDTLSSRGPNDSVAYWTEQTFRAIQRIEKERTSRPKPDTPPTVAPMKPTWASIAAKHTLHPLGAPRWVHEDTASLRQLKVRITDLTERKTVWTTANRSILEKVAAEARGSGIVGVRKLPSGDILVQLKEQASKEKLARSQKWLEQISPSAKLVPDLFPVMVHGVRMSSINIADQQQANKRLADQNRILHPNLRIIRTTWARGAGASGKVKASLLVFVSSPTEANQIVTEGFIEGGEVHITERFFAGCGLVQCFKCCSYGHIAKHCRIEPRCGHCASTHETRDCTTKEKSFCPCCKARGLSGATHKAWSELCPVRKDVRTQLAYKFANRPLLYPTVTKPDARDPITTTTTERRRPGRPRKIQATEETIQTAESEGTRGTKRPRQSTLPFAKDDLMED